MVSKKNHPIDEKRQYQRLDHIFPVEFQFLDEKGQPQSDWHQGFTQDVSSGGLCLIINQVNECDLKFFADKASSLILYINIPLGAQAVQARVHPAWMKCLKEGLINQYVVGLAYQEIESRGNKRILKYVMARKFFKALAIAFSIMLSLALVWTGFYNGRLRFENEKLLFSLSDNLVRQKNLLEGRNTLKLKIEEMNFSLSQANRKAELLERELLLTGHEDQKTVDELKSAVAFFKKYQEGLKSDLAGLQQKKTQVDRAVNTKAQEAVVLEKKVSEKLCHWLAVHQNTRTGLLPSFEGDADTNDWAFTYDQALAAIAFTDQGAADLAQRILDFYLHAPSMDDGGFANAYYASSGDVAEFMAHVGPNTWLGLAILQYTNKTKDKKYLDLARSIARWLDTMKDEEGGLRGGRALTWYSTEHNLDAYAFYNMLYQLTQETTYQTRAEELLSWLNKNAYSSIGNPLIKRGKGDSTIATDTYAWSISAIGAGKLKEIGMEPDSIMDFAIDNCSVSVDYKRPEGYLVRVKGFDFAKLTNEARGGVISCEWSAQMILALKLMSRYHEQAQDQDKAQNYQHLANDYLSELSKMIITSPSPVGQGEFCLPYSSHEFVDTGHGWRTPKGNRTGSVAATAYAIFAIEGFNPLSLNDEGKAA